MNITSTQVTMLTITTEFLDPIRVFLQDYEPGKGRITIECWGRAWSAYWGGMAGGTLSQFVPTCGPDYIVNCLITGLGERLKRSIKHEDEYLLRIVKVVQEAIRVQQRIDLHGVAAQ